MSATEIPPFTAAVATGTDRAIVRLRGELDLATRPELLSAVESAEATGLPVVEMDLRELTFIDSTGIGSLLAVTDRGRKNGHRVEFLLGHGPVDRTLRIAGVDRLLPRAA
jgi:anti-sigma B factor antagonist